MILYECKCLTEVDYSEQKPRRSPLKMELAIL